MNARKIVIVCVGVVLIAPMLFVVLLCNCRQPLLSPEVPIAGSPAEVRVKAVERNPVAAVVAVTPNASRVIAIICGKDPATANRYEERNSLGDCPHS